jgi:hypothetical protein
LDPAIGLNEKAEKLYEQKDYKQAAELFLEAANLEHQFAQAKLGMMYKKGLGVPKNNTIAFQWLLKAAKQGNNSAQNNVADMYQKGIGVTQNYSQAYIWYTKASEMRNPYALYSLGELSYLGTGAERNYLDAYKWAYLAHKCGYKENGTEVEVHLLEKAQNELTITQIEDAEQQAKVWEHSHPYSLMQY